MSKVAVVGSGSWGTALAILQARKGTHVKLWTRTHEEAKRLNDARENATFLKGFKFPRRLKATSSLEEALGSADAVIIAVPAQSMRENAKRIREYITRPIPIVSATKGLEMDSCKRMSEVIEEEIKGSPCCGVCVISGPNIAQEAVQGPHSVAVVASQSSSLAEEVRLLLMTKCFCLYTSTDVVGVELGGALKNIVALGTGIADGLGHGANGKAAFITRGLAEITGLGVAMRADPLTFSGLAGLGDMMATCFSPYSRNRFVGEELGKGRSLKDITASIPHIAEGITTSHVAQSMAQKMGVDMPVACVLNKVLYEGLQPQKAVNELIKPPVKQELAIIKESVPVLAHPARTGLRRWQLGLQSQPAMGVVPG